MSNTIPANNNTSLYNGTGNVVPTNGNINATNISASGNVTVGGYILAQGSITTASNFVGNLVGNVTGNITIVGANDSVLFIENNATTSSTAFSFDPTSNIVSVTGNVSANYFIGNGSQLTGISAIGTNYSNANVSDFLPVYNGNVNSTTIFGNNVAIQGRDWSQLQYAPGGVPADQTNLGTGSWFYLDSDGAAFESNTTGTFKTVFFGNDGQVSASGNITAPYFIGNGSQLTGVVTSSYGNSNVANYLPTYTGNFTANVISTIGNIVSAANLVTSGSNGNIVGANYVVANIYLGDGGQLSNITGNYSNANVANYLPTYGGTLLANLINFTNNSGIIEQGTNRLTITGNANSVNTGAYFNDDGEADIFANSAVNIVTNTANVTNPQWTFDALGNLSAPGSISALGNITANYFIGNGSQLTGITSTYGNSNVATFLNNFGSNAISTSGNITANYFIGNGSQLTGITSTYGNSNVATFLGAFGSNAISTSGNVTAGQLFQTSNTVAIGQFAGSITQTEAAIAIGRNAGQNTQGGNAVAIGRNAGNTTQSAYSIAIGFLAGQISQGGNCVAIGRAAGNNTQGNNSVAIGQGAAANVQGSQSVAIGYISAGNASGAQGNNSVAIGSGSAYTNQGANAFAMGYNSAYKSQGGNAIAIGALAAGNITASTGQGDAGVAIGYQAAYNNQGVNAIAIGFLAAGNLSGAQGANAIAIGRSAGAYNQGISSIAIGYQAGLTSQANNTIILNATGATLNQTTANTFTVSPVRSVAGNVGAPIITPPTGFYFAAYNPTTGEFIYFT